MFETKKNKIIATTLLFILLAFLGLKIIDKVESDKKTYYLNVQSQLFENRYKTWHKYFKIMSQDIHSMYENNGRLMSLLDKAIQSPKEEQDKIRKDIYKMLIRNYKRLENMGISQVHFHLPDNRSFLRMYAPERYDDDLSQTRKSVVLANKTLKPQEGFEACPYMVGYRFVYPLFHNNKHIGSVEISYSDSSIVKNIVENFVYDSHILVSKDIAENTIIAHKYGIIYKDTWESDEYYIDESTHKKIKDTNFYEKLHSSQLKQKLQKKIESAKPFCETVDYNYQQIVTNFLPLPSVDGVKNIAYIVTYTKSSYLSRLEVEENYVTLLFLIVIFLVYAFSIYMIITREKLKELALFDTLTQLPNRALFKVELHNELMRAYRYKRKAAILFMDLDGFKEVNDTYGHHTGDEILQFVAHILSSSIRSVDIAARFAGDEFVVLLSNIKEDEDAIQVAKTIINKINEGTIINHKVITLGASIGISIYPEHSQDADELLKLADAAMYKAKESGKNRVIIHHADKKENN
jgi:diguanylate cyclase (GGDEF)-like protein